MGGLFFFSFFLLLRALNTKDTLHTFPPPSRSTVHDYYIIAEYVELRNLLNHPSVLLAAGGSICQQMQQFLLLTSFFVDSSSNAKQDNLLLFFTTSRIALLVKTSS